MSPQTRATETCRLAGFADLAEVRDDLVEWDYGEYEGFTDEETQAHATGWDLFRDGAPGGETPKQVSDRVDRAIATVLEAPGYWKLRRTDEEWRSEKREWMAQAEADLAAGPAAA